MDDLMDMLNRVVGSVSSLTEIQKIISLTSALVGIKRTLSDPNVNLSKEEEEILKKLAKLIRKELKIRLMLYENTTRKGGELD